MKFLLKKQKGFTLIELLVVIAIIGILASIVLVSLGGARTSAKDAAIKANMETMKLAMEMHYNNSDTLTYVGGAASVLYGYGNALAAVEVNNGDGVGVTDVEKATAYCISSKLATNALQCWCVDSTGYVTPKGTLCADVTCSDTVGAEVYTCK